MTPFLGPGAAAGSGTGEADGTPRIAVVIVSYNTRELTLEAVASVRNSDGVKTEVWVVDNASVDGSAEAVREQFPGANVVVLDENVGFGRANNVAFARLRTPWILLLNSDARFADRDGLARLAAVAAAHPDVGIVGPRLETPAGRIEFSARSFPGIASELLRPTGAHRLLPSAASARLLGSEFHDHNRRAEVDWLTGACLLVRREVIEEVGGFDPAIFLYGEELEWSWRVRKAGWRIVFEPEVLVHHERAASSPGASGLRLHLALRGDMYAVRTHRGPLYLGAFAVARSLGLAAEVIVQGALGLIPGHRTRRERSRAALTTLRGWISVLVASGSGEGRP